LRIKAKVLQTGNDRERERTLREALTLSIETS
jgi:hypothetical protein